MSQELTAEQIQEFANTLPADVRDKLTDNVLRQMAHNVYTFDDREKHTSVIEENFKVLVGAMKALVEAEKEIDTATELFVESGGDHMDLAPYYAYRIASGKPERTRGRATSWRTVAQWYADGQPEFAADDDDSEDKPKRRGRPRKADSNK